MVDFDKIISDLASQGDLAGYAAADATKTLSENWKKALADGYDLTTLIGDVDATIERLKIFRMEVLLENANFPAHFPVQESTDD